MQKSPTMLDRLATDQWVLWLPTAVTLSTLSMEGAPRFVRVMGLGVGQLQLMKVSLFHNSRCNDAYLTCAHTLTDSVQDTTPHCTFDIIPVVGGVVAVVIVLFIVVGVVTVSITYLILRHKGGKAK